MNYFAAIALALSMALPVAAQEATWADFQDNIFPRAGDLGGQLLVTTDAKWREKWNSAPEVIPQFTRVTEPIALGQQISILIFFANPQLSSDGMADLTCDVDVTKPDGTSSVHLADTECYRGVLLGKPGNVYLAAPEMRFLYEPGDQPGTWTVRVALRDNLRKTAFPLQTSFTLQ